MVSLIGKASARKGCRRTYSEHAEDWKHGYGCKHILGSSPPPLT